MQINKILIFNPFGIGDVLFSTPLVRNLKESIPNVTIHYLCNQRVYPLLKNYPFLDKVFVFEKDEWRDTLKKSKLAFIKKTVSFFKEIKKEKYDVVFDLSLNPQYGFFLKMSGIKKRVGFNFKNRGRFLTDKIDITYGYSDKHVARYHLELLKFLDITPKDYRFDLVLSEESLQKVKGIFEQSNICEKDTLIAICPGSGDSWRDTAYFKRWPQENFSKLCVKLKEELKAKILLFGSKPEESICAYISEELIPFVGIPRARLRQPVDEWRSGTSPALSGRKEKDLRATPMRAPESSVINLCGKIDLEEFCAAISLCSLVVTNDGGPFHIAQAVGKKAIVLFGPVDEKVYGAYPVTDNCVVFAKHVSCRPCYKSFRFSGCSIDKQCLRVITVEEVFLAAKSLLKV